MSSNLPARSDEQRKSIFAPKNTDVAQVEAALRLYAQGSRVKDLAKELDITDVCLYRLFLHYYPDEFREFQGAHAVAKLQDSEDKLDGSDTMTHVSRAQAQIRAQQWRLERALSRIYGAKQELTINTPPTLNVTIVQVIDNNDV